MHEVSLVADLVEECARRANGHPVATVRIRHANTLDDDGLRELFAMCGAGGPLAHAVLESEQFDVELACSACGFTGTVDSDHVYGHLRVCPACGALSDDDDTAELELVDVVLDG